MDYELVTGKGVTITPAKQGAIYKGIVGDGLVKIYPDDARTVYTEGNTSAKICAGTYLYKGRHIEIYNDIIYDLSNVEDGAFIGFMYTRTDTSEVIEQTVQPAGTMKLTNPDLQTSGLIPFASFAWDGDKIAIQEKYVVLTSSMEDTANPIIIKESIYDTLVSGGSTKLFSLDSAPKGMYLVLFDVLIDQEPTKYLEIKVKSRTDNARDHSIEIKTKAGQVAAIYECKTEEASLGPFVEAYLWNPDQTQELTVTKAHFELFQLKHMMEEEVIELS